mgnify:CR=1 FL=1
MAMIKCPECGNEVSNKAEKCPSCGVTIKKKSSCLGNCGSIGCLFFLLLFFIGALGANRNNDRRSTYTTPNYTNTKKEEQVKTIKTETKVNEVSSKTDEKKDKETIYKIGQTIKVGNWSYTVNKKEWVSDSLVKSYNPIFNQKSEYSFLQISLTAKNEDTSSNFLPNVHLVDEKNNVFEPANVHGEKVLVLGLDEVNPSLSKKGLVIFDVPKDRKYRLKLNGGGLIPLLKEYVELN